jgi:hypothetical protein
LPFQVKAKYSIFARFCGVFLMLGSCSTVFVPRIEKKRMPLYPYGHTSELAFYSERGSRKGVSKAYPTGMLRDAFDIVHCDWPQRGATRMSQCIWVWSVLSLTVPAIIIEHLCCFVKRENCSLANLPPEQPFFGCANKSVRSLSPLEGCPQSQRPGRRACGSIRSDWPGGCPDRPGCGHANSH